MARTLTDLDYQQLLEFRTGLRRFLHWSEEQAAAVGLTPAQHQLLLAIRGFPGHAGPTIGDVADTLHLRHHSVGGLVDRAEAAGLVERHPDRNDHRAVRLRVTPTGLRSLDRLTEAHLTELAQLADRLRPLWAGFAERGHFAEP